MISMVEELRNIVAKDFVSSDDKGNSILLQESQFSACQSFNLIKGNAKTFTLKVDTNDFDLHPLLKNGIKHLKKQPDYIIFCENRNGQFCLIIELKSSNKDDWHRQVKAGLSTAQYLVGMLENYTKKDFSSVEYRCLLFHTKNVRPKVKKKKKTKDRAFQYDIHPIFKYQYTDQPCSADRPLPLFMR